MIPSHIYLVLGSSAVGGLASFALSAVTGQSLGKLEPGVLSLLCHVILGAVAGMVGVYLIAKTSTGHKGHLIAFAMLCGLFWRPVLDAGAGYIRSNEVFQTEAQDQEKSASDLEKDMKSGSPDPAKSIKAADSTAKLIAVAELNNNVRQKAEATNRSMELIKVLKTQRTDRNPQLSGAAQGALESLRRSAAKSGNKEVEDAAANALRAP